MKQSLALFTGLEEEEDALRSAGEAWRFGANELRIWILHPELRWRTC